MEYGESYIKSIVSLNAEIKRLNEQAKKMREHKKIIELSLYEWMKRNNLEEYKGIKITRIAPKPKVPRKKPSEKKNDALTLFRNIGIPDPEDFYLQYQQTQKISPPN